MPDPNKLPHLLKLLDDESGIVQDAIWKELLAYGPGLEEELEILSRRDPSQKIKLRNFLDQHEKQILKQEWTGWFNIPGEKEKLEFALSLIADFQNPPSYSVKLKSVLDRLANEFIGSNVRRDACQLGNFLFKAKHFKGAIHDYYNPQNSNLVYVIERRTGIPISLACVYMLVGYRVGIEIEGCNFPGHFFARAEFDGKRYLVDCFNGGKFMEENILLALNESFSETTRQLIQMKVDAFTVVKRVLANLIRAYDLAGNANNVELFQYLLELTERGKI